ncbi:SPOR domain-containing protein [Undibacterium luofuense]|uniref:SPOR domain-containing protein n=1 Tax=Undibacterium luofuense TaxID=2828733 RepID=A0A941DHB6_9BURK|nr:SPOR domain-containing protein [Undibacterium luofuense]MBR7780763.1 SPOR domain-containing protein [Undibacterium luofuense]
MLRSLFWLLLAANAGLAAFQMGWLGHWTLDTREPERLKQQHHVNLLKQVSASAASAPAPDSADTDAAKTDAEGEKKAETKADGKTDTKPDTKADAKPEAKPEPKAEKKPEPLACMEIGNFQQSDLAKVEEKLRTLGLGDRQTRVNISETATHMVYIPSQGSKEGADKKVGELKRIGVGDYFVIQDQSALKWSISLGVFKTEEAAKQHLAQLNNKGVRTARIMPRAVSSTRFAFQFRQVTADEQAKWDSIKASLPAFDTRSCQDNKTTRQQ